MRALALALVVAGALAQSLQPLPVAPAKPSLPTQFVARVQEDVKDLGPASAAAAHAHDHAGVVGVHARGVGRDYGLFPGSVQTMWYDEERMASRTDQLLNFTAILPHCQYANSTSLVTATDNWLVMAEQCRSPSSATFAPMWKWVDAAAYQGQQTVQGKLCDVWFLSYKDTFNGTLYSHGDDPVVLVEQVVGGGLPGTTPRRTQITFSFLALDRTAPPASVFATPLECQSLPPPPCESGEVEEMTFYIAHPKADYNITDQDAADLFGDVLFTCFDVLSNHTNTDDYSVVSQYTVRVDTHWGQYAMCNGYHPPMCVGSDPFHVGRETTIGCGVKAGQCEANAEDGFWFSFPAGGECTGGKDIHKGECSWEVVERVKTVELGCLFDTLGMAGLCAKGAHLAAAAFLKGFSADAASGGCDDVPPPARA